MATLQSLQDRLANIVDNSATAPTAGGEDWNLRLDLINRAQNEWAELYDWQVLYTEYHTLTTEGNASISLPQDFRKLAAPPRIAWGLSKKELPEIRPTEKSRYADNDQYVMVLGNRRDGYTLYINPPSVASGLSLQIPYYRSAPSLASPADVTLVPNPDFLVERAAAEIWRARGDERYSLAKAEAEKILARMLEFESTRGESYYDYVPNFQEIRKSFRIGRDG